MKFQAHINCEILNSVAAVKYFYKYIMKGSDRILVNMRRTDSPEKYRADEIELFLNARNILAIEAFWRIYDFALSFARGTNSYTQERRSPKTVTEIHVEI